MSTQQQTLKNESRIEGIGLHSGCRSSLIFQPAPADTGIVFCRSDGETLCRVLARYDHVVDTRNCTCLGANQTPLVSTIEHLMAALYAADIDNLCIVCNNRELPIMDGSAQCFYTLLKNAEKKVLSAPRRVLKILKEVSFRDDKGNEARLLPSEVDGLQIRFEIEFPSEIVGRQVFDDTISTALFEGEIAPSRTFCEKYQIDYLRSLGLIRGGSLENAVVLDGNSILNPEGFRVRNECVKHKVLDAIGDLYTSGYYISGRYEAYHTGHYHNNELLKKLFADSANYRII